MFCAPPCSQTASPGSLPDRSRIRVSSDFHAVSLFFLQKKTKTQSEHIEQSCICMAKYVKSGCVAPGPLPDFSRFGLGPVGCSVGCPFARGLAVSPDRLVGRPVGRPEGSPATKRVDCRAVSNPVGLAATQHESLVARWLVGPGGCPWASPWTRLDPIPGGQARKHHASTPRPCANGYGGHRDPNPAP